MLSIILAKDSWVIGDGVGGTEVRVGKVASKLACYVLCYHRKKNGVLANGATVDTKTGTNCYCEYGMKKRNRVKKWMTTFINRGLLFIFIFSEITECCRNLEFQD